ncbi:ankyrin and armadillo repeat-containing protein-like [Babylonia areolata]|uniref:ankyrin and armadillo repeat-containing protein-like n=1 Tax=Babylonia areolata TaxID=304850 RepID=UPI003FCFDB56
MNEPDEMGWCHVHHCAFRGYVKSLERFVDNDPESLELQTQDDLSCTPFLLAVSSGIQDAVTCLINLGAKVDVVNTQNHGAVEICAIKQFVSLLRYFLDLQLPKLPVWRHLLRLLGSDLEEEVYSAGTCLRALTDPTEGGGLNPNWEEIYNNGGVPVISRVAKSGVADDSKIPALQLLLNVIGRPEVRVQLVASGGVQPMIRLLRSPDTFVVQLAAMVIRELGKDCEHSELLMQNGAVPAIYQALQSVRDPEVQTSTVQAIGSIAAAGPKQRAAVGTTPGCIETMIELFETATGQGDLQTALIQAVSSVARGSPDNQNAFVNGGVTQHIVNVILTQSRDKDLQQSAVEAVHCLAEGNPHVGHEMLERGVERLLMQLLKKRNAESLQEKTAMALWALAGSDANEKKKMAGAIGIQTLVEFVNSSSDHMQLIGSEGLGALAQGPLNHQPQIAAANGIHPLVRLLRSSQEGIVLSAIRSLRHLCISVGNVPCPPNQNTISTSRGVKLLVALMVHSFSEEIQAEAAFTLASVSLGNADILEEVKSNLDFSYVRLLKMMYTEDPEVRLLAGWALATFAYNNVQQQTEIANEGGVRFKCYLPFLRSDNDLHRCTAAYQVVVLARIIPDMEQADSSAAGIKLLVEILGSSKDDHVRTMAASFIACLAHTRAGVPSALVAVQAVECLCNLLISPSDQVRGHAAVALCYLSYNSVGQRHLLHRCRSDPYLMQVIKHFTKRYKLSSRLSEGWKHCKKVGLPSIPEGRPSLTTKPPHDDLRHVLSFESASQVSSQLRGSASHAPTEQMTGRSSRAFHETHRSLQASQMSLDSRRSHMSLPEVMVENVS